ncbi:radical SAM protein, partial [Myxococcota bacterium]|nr:radical SAM protein [Myxococcota bacterium]
MSAHSFSPLVFYTPLAVLIPSSESSFLLRFVTSGAEIKADGRLANILWTVIQEGDAPGFSLLEKSNPAFRVLRDFHSSEKLPLTYGNALRLSSFSTLFVELTNECNERCIHCYASSAPGGTSLLKRNHLDAVLRDAKKLGFKRVQFTGGEPLLSPLLIDGLKLGRELGIATLEIYTNGVLLDEQKLGELIEFKPDFAFSFYSDSAEVHDGITRLEGSHQKTLEAILRVKKAGLSYRVSIVTMEANQDHIERTRKFLRAQGVESISSAPVKEVGRGSTQQTTLKVPDESHRGEYKPQAIEGKLAIQPDGTVTPC